MNRQEQRNAVRRRLARGERDIKIAKWFAASLFIVVVISRWIILGYSIIDDVDVFVVLLAGLGSYITMMVISAIRQRKARKEPK